MSIVYLNGGFMPADEAMVPVLDRGFIFGDGIYEVIPVYSGRLFRLEHHLERLDNSLAGIRLAPPRSHDEWRAILETLVEKNGGGDQSVYLQVTRGVAKRDHGFPPEAEPTVFAMSNPMSDPAETLSAGIEAITVEDIRWKLCNIKSIALLPNILLRQKAIDAGAGEAVLLREGEVTEGAAANIFIVKNGVVITPPKSNLLLPGITRDLVVEICQANAIPCEERVVSEAELRDADEVWVSSSTKEVVPVIKLDGETVGAGSPGPMWRQVLSLYQDYKQAVREGRAE